MNTVCPGSGNDTSSFDTFKSLAHAIGSRGDYYARRTALMRNGSLQDELPGYLRLPIL